jgi:hypothetical protein
MPARYTILQTNTNDDASYPTDNKGRRWTTNIREAHTWATVQGAANAARFWGSHMVVVVPKGER